MQARLVAAPEMRIAAVYDVHGNLPALEAVLAEPDLRTSDLILFGGDICWGPLPEETLDLARSVGERARFVRGNADRELAAGADEGDGLEGWVAEVNLWCYGRLSVDQRTFLGGLPQTISIDDTLFCHGSPRRDDEAMTPFHPESSLEEMLSAVAEPLVVCGHTHVRFDHQVAGKRIVNPGSLGLPMDEPGAPWALLEDEVTFRNTTYDIDGARERFLATGGPHMEGFADHISAPPPGEEHLRRFADQ